MLINILGICGLGSCWQHAYRTDMRNCITMCGATGHRLGLSAARRYAFT